MLALAGPGGLRAPAARLVVQDHHRRRRAAERRGKPSSSYPVRPSATLSGVKLRNAGDESCGGSLANSFAHSCNSVFGPLGAKVGAKRLLAMAEKFGFNEQPDLPAAKVSTIPKAPSSRTRSPSARRAIGQDTDNATPLGMASVAATIANQRRAHEAVAGGRANPRKRVVSAKVAGQVRDMMIAVVTDGTGKRRRDPGRHVAGKTGTAELVSTADIAQDPRTRPPGSSPSPPPPTRRSAVAVMLPNAGQGGASAAPIAKRVLQAAL